MRSSSTRPSTKLCHPLAARNGSFSYPGIRLLSSAQRTSSWPPITHPSPTVSSTYARPYNKFYQEHFKKFFHLYAKSLNIEVNLSLCLSTTPQQFVQKFRPVLGSRRTFSKILPPLCKKSKYRGKFVSVSKHNTPTICSKVQTSSGVYPASCSMGPVVVPLRESYFIVISKSLINIPLGPCSATVSCLLSNPALLNLLRRAGNFWQCLVCMGAT